MLRVIANLTLITLGFALATLANGLARPFAPLGRRGRR